MAESERISPEIVAKLLDEVVETQHRLLPVVQQFFGDIDKISVRDLSIDPHALLSLTQIFERWIIVIDSEFPFKSEFSRNGCIQLIDGLQRNLDYMAQRLKAAGTLTPLPIESSDYREVAVQLRRVIEFNRKDGGQGRFKLSDQEARDIYFYARNDLAGHVYLVREFIRLRKETGRTSISEPVAVATVTEKLGLNIDWQHRTIRRTVPPFNMDHLVVDWEKHHEKWDVFNRICRSFPTAIKGSVSGTSRQTKSQMNEDLEKLGVRISKGSHWTLEIILTTAEGIDGG